MSNITMNDDEWLGLGASAGRIEFDDQATDEINFKDCHVGIGTSTPGERLEVAGNVKVNNGFLEMDEVSLPANPTNDTVRIFAQEQSGTGASGTGVFARMPNKGVKTGTATGGSSTTCIDTTKNFENEGIVIGMIITNTTQGGEGKITGISTTTNTNDTLTFTVLSGTPTFSNGNGYSISKADIRNIAATDWVNAKDFGACGDEVTDDTTAIQAAIDSLVMNWKSGVVYFPIGTYIITSTLFIGGGQGDAHHGDGIILLGASSRGSILKADRNEPTENLDGSSYATYDSNHITTYTKAGGDPAPILPSVGDLVHIEGFTNTTFNGDYSVLEVSGSTFKVFNPNASGEESKAIQTNATYTRNMHILQIRGGQDAPTYGAGVKNLGFQLTETQGNRHIAVNIQAGMQCVIEGIDIYSPGGLETMFLEGIRVQSWANTIRESHVDYCTTCLNLQSGYLLWTIGQPTGSNMNLIMGMALENFLIGILIKGADHASAGMKCQGNAIIGCVIEGENDDVDAKGVFLDERGESTFISGSYFEGNYRHIYIRSNYNSIIGNFMAGTDNTTGITVETGCEIGNTVLGNKNNSAGLPPAYQSNFIYEPLGIGTTDPAAKLHLADGGGGSGYKNLLQSGSNISDSIRMRAGYNDSAGGDRSHYISVNSSDPTTTLTKDLSSYGASAINMAPTTSYYEESSGGGIDFQTAKAAETSLTSALFISQNRCVGIGTTSPQKRLHVCDSSVGGSYTTDAQLILENDDSAGLNIKSASDCYGRIDFGDDGGAARGSVLYYHDADHMQFLTNGSAKLTIKSDGKIGAGTDSPSELLTVEGNIKVQGNTSGLMLPETTSEPSSPPDGMIIYKKTAWGTGGYAGEGAYVRYNSTWNKLG